MIADGPPVTSLPTASLWRSAAPHRRSAEDRARIVGQLVESRQSRPNDPATPSFQRAALTTPQTVRPALGLPPAQRDVLVCPDVPFDPIFYPELGRPSRRQRAWQTGQTWTARVRLKQ